MAETDRKPKEPVEDAQWDLKRGKPEDPGATRIIEKAHGNYSASEQGEDRQKRHPPEPPKSNKEDGYAHEPKQR